MTPELVLCAPLDSPLFRAMVSEDIYKLHPLTRSDARVIPPLTHPSTDPCLAGLTSIL